MIRPDRRLAKKIKFLPFISALLFALAGLYIMRPNTYAASINTFHLASTSAATPRPPAVTSTQSDNWSGYEATNSPGKFKKVQCLAKVPTLTSNGEVSSWCGLGGDPGAVPGGSQNTVLVQAGVDSCVGTSCTGNNSGAQHNYAWWEIADALVVQPVRFTKGVHNGDSMYFYIQSDPRTGSSEDKFYLRNMTTKESHTIIVNSQGATEDGNSISINTINGTRFTTKGINRGGGNNIPILSDGATVECIVERPLDAISNTLANLPIFGSEKVQACDAGIDGQAFLIPIGTLPNVSKIDMFNNSPAGQGNQGRNSARQAAVSNGAIAQPSTLNCSPHLDCFIVGEPDSGTQHTRNSFLRFID